MAADPYQILGVPKDAPHAEIKRAFRRLARQYHPDRNPDDAAAEERFKAVQNAWEQLETPEKRTQYDEEQQMQEAFGGFGGMPGGMGGMDLGDMRDEEERASILGQEKVYQKMGLEYRKVWRDGETGE